MQKKSKDNSSTFAPSLPLLGNSKSLAISTKPVKFNTPNSSGDQSARMDGSTQPATQGYRNKRGTRVQTDLAREAQQTPLNTIIDMKDKQERPKFKGRYNRKEYGTTEGSGTSSFSYNTPEMFTESLRRKPGTEVYATKKVTRATRDLSVNLSTINLVPNFPNDTDADKATSKKESAMWLAFSEVFNEIRSDAYKNKRNDSFTVLTKDNLWSYWTTLSLAISLYTTLINLTQGAIRNPGNWSLEQISFTLNANAELLRWMDVLGQVLNDRVFPTQYAKAIAWHNTPKYANNCANSNMILTLNDAMMLPTDSTESWNKPQGWVDLSLIPAIQILVDQLRDDDIYNRVDNLLRSSCTDRINVSTLCGVSNGYDPAYTEMFANDVVRISEASGARMYPVLADANNNESISYYVSSDIKSPTFGAYFTSAVSSEQSGNAASGESVTWFRRIVYLNTIESLGIKSLETNVFNSAVATDGSFIWMPRNNIVDNMITPSCHIATTLPDCTDINQKFVSVPKTGMQAVDYFTTNFQYNTFQSFIKTILSVQLG